MMKIYFEILIYILSFLGGIVSIVTIYRWCAPYKKINWRTVEKGIVKLKEEGALLSGCLGHVPLLVIDRVYDWKDNIRKDRLFEQINLSSNLEKVLLVAGELHTGGTARVYIEYFKKMGAKQIKYLTFTKDRYPAFQPDFFYIETKKPI